MGKAEQMSFLFEEGGIADDGMDRDPVSGNEVPPGSLAKEVRDDIPAQLSEGEYVVPADVVQYYGLKFFEDLRMQAKMGLAQMEESGREEFTRRELIEGLIDTINNGIWDLSDGELEDLAEVLGLDVKCFKHGIFFVKSLD